MIASPCIKACAYSLQLRMCGSCGRTSQEISEWTKASDERQRAIIEAAAARLRAHQQEIT